MVCCSKALMKDMVGHWSVWPVCGERRREKWERKPSQLYNCGKNQISSWDKTALPYNCFWLEPLLMSRTVSSLIPLGLQSAFPCFYLFIFLQLFDEVVSMMTGIARQPDHTHAQLHYCCCCCRLTGANNPAMFMFYSFLKPVRHLVLA